MGCENVEHELSLGYQKKGKASEFVDRWRIKSTIKNDEWFQPQE